MRVAYCMAGHLRRFRENPTLRKYLFDVNPGDIFVHTYPVLNVPDRAPCWHNDKYGNMERLSPRHIGELFAMYPEIKALEIDSKECGADHLEPALQAMGFRWSWCRAVDIARSYWELHDRYDVVFNVRPDLWLYEPLRIIPPERNTIYGGVNLNQERRGNDGDVFLYGSPGNMVRMHARPVPVAIAPQVPHWGCVGERLVTQIRVDAELAHVQHKTRYGILRSDGIMAIDTGHAPQ